MHNNNKIKYNTISEMYYLTTLALCVYTTVITLDILIEDQGSPRFFSTLNKKKIYRKVILKYIIYIILKVRI